MTASWISAPRACGCAMSQTTASTPVEVGERLGVLGVGHGHDERSGSHAATLDDRLAVDAAVHDRGPATATRY